jgi:hypothetical protein
MLLLWNLSGYALEWLYLLYLRNIPIKDVGSGLPKIVAFLKDSWNRHVSFWLWCFEHKVCMIKLDTVNCLSYPCFERNCFSWQSHGSVAAYGIFQIKIECTCILVLLPPLYIKTISLQHVSALKGPSSESANDTFQKQDQQNVLSDVKFCKSKHINK